MGTYINPPEKVQQVGRSIQGSTYEQLTAQLNEDEVLFGLYDCVMFQYAPHMQPLAEFEYFVETTRANSTKCVGFYAVPRIEMESAS